EVVDVVRRDHVETRGSCAAVRTACITEGPRLAEVVSELGEMHPLDTLELCRSRGEVVRRAGLDEKQTLVVPVARVTSRASRVRVGRRAGDPGEVGVRSEEHTSELQSRG